MTDATFTFTLDGREIEAREGETVFEAAERAGVFIPHLCHREGYAPAGQCRACMIEVEGERRLSPACRRKAEPGMVVLLENSPRADRTRRLVFELLMADRAEKSPGHDALSSFRRQAERLGVTGSRFPSTREGPEAGRDDSHPAFTLFTDACIHCGLCVRACRDIQVNEVLSLAGRAKDLKVCFDFDDPVRESSCVACGECVMVCPAGALTPGTLLDAEGHEAGHADDVVETVCPYCGVGCRLEYHVRDGRIVLAEGADGPANAKRLCVKGRFAFDYVAHPQRLTRPLIRREGAPKGLNVDPSDPSTHFREASWDEALDAAAAGFRKVLERHGPGALAGFGSAKGSNEEAYLFQKLIRAGFGSNNVDHCTRLCHASSVAALMEMIGSGAVTAPFTEVANSEVIVVIGANPAENHPVAATWIKQAAKRGAKLIVMDPRGQALRRHATLMLQFHAGSDVALLNAMMHVIMREGLVDEEFLERRTHGWEELKRHLARFAPEPMSQLCGVPAKKIRSAAKFIGEARSVMFLWGMGVTQHVHGTDNARAIIDLALMTGNVGKPGAGLHPLRGQNNVQGASDAGLIPMVLPDYRPVSDPEARRRLEDLWGTRLDGTPGLTVVEIMDAARAGDIRAMYIMGENPAMSDPDLNHTRAALASLEHLVVQDIFPTETAMFADVVLPAAAWPEKRGTVTNTNRQIQMGRPAVAPPGEARPDWWIIREIARRLGLEWDFEEPRDVFAEMKHAMPSLDNITWDRLEREGSVTYPCPAPDHPGRGIVFEREFPTADGKARLVPVDLVPPDERPDGDWPFVLTTGRVLEHWHTGAMTRRAEVTETLEPEPFVAMNPQDMAFRRIEPGQMVRVATRRGEVTVMARPDNRVSEGLLFMPFAYVEAAANLLTNPKLDPHGKIPELKFSAARVEPVPEDRPE